MEIEENMKMYFEHKIDSIDRNIDVENAVMTKIASPMKRTYNKGILAFIIIILMCMASTGIVYGEEIYKYIKNMDFMNTKGEVEWSITTDEEDYGNYRDKANEVFDNLDIEEGKAVAIYVVDNNPQNIVVGRQKPITVHDIDVINSYNSDSLNVALNKNILDKYYFKTGTVTFDMSTFDIDIDAMIKESNETGNSVIIKEIKVTKYVRSTTNDYYLNSSNTEGPYFTVTIVKWNGNELIKSGDDDKLIDFASVMVGDSEVLYEEMNNMKLIKWISGECYFDISSTQEAMTMEELLKIAEQIRIK